jgi:pyrroloquinoline quinone (PQQ) biosynthesis protein C
MSVPNDLQEHSICSMYRDGVSLHTLEVAFDKSAEEIIEALHRHGVVAQDRGESWESFVARIQEDVKHKVA